VSLLTSAASGLSIAPCT